MENLFMSLMLFMICYIIVTMIGMVHTIFNIFVLHMKPMDENSMGEGYERTKPWHPLYNIIIFPLFGFMYLKGLANPTLKEAIITGLIWVIISIIGDLIGWVVIKHKWSLTFKEFYIDYQPWITLVYIIIFLGPIIGFTVLN